MISKLFQDRSDLQRKAALGIALFAASFAGAQGCSVVTPLDKPDDGTHSGTNTASGGQNNTASGGTPHASGGSSTSHGGSMTSTGGSRPNGSGGTGNQGGDTGSGGDISVGGGPDAHGGSPGCETFELLTDGDLETAPGTVWVEVSSGGYALVRDASNLGSISPQSGNQAAWMGGAASEDSGLGQEVYIPSGTTELTASGYYGVTGTETTTSDYAALSLGDPASSSVLGIFETWYGDEVTSPWQPFSVTVDGSALGGTTVNYLIGSSTDATDNSNFYFDNLSLTATVCP